MTVGELIHKLSIWPDNTEVTITDGFQARCYSGAFEVILFSDGEKVSVDIGIGGCEE